VPRYTAILRALFVIPSTSAAAAASSRCSVSFAGAGLDSTTIARIWSLTTGSRKASFTAATRSITSAEVIHHGVVRNGLAVSCMVWRTELKIRRPQGLTSSMLVFGTT
jgi:hypothetical protein